MPMRETSDLIADMRRGQIDPPRIQRIDPGDTDDGVKRWLITFDDGRQGSTVNANLAQECYRLMGLHMPVNIQRSKMRYGYALTKIEAAGTL